MEVATVFFCGVKVKVGTNTAKSTPLICIVGCTYRSKSAKLRLMSSFVCLYSYAYYVRTVMDTRRQGRPSYGGGNRATENARVEKSPGADYRGGKCRSSHMESRTDIIQRYGLKLLFKNCL